MIEDLRKVGFDDKTARGLAQRQSEEVIRAQLEWITLRQATSSRLGLLRRAIEENWPKPEPTTVAAEHELGRAFAESFGQTYHQAKPISCSPREAAVAAEFLTNLKANANPEQAAEWGRRFALFIKGKSPKNHWLVGLIRQYGQEFSGRTSKVSQTAGKVSIQARRCAHEKEFEAAHLSYLTSSMNRGKATEPALWSAFVAHREDIRVRLKLGQAACAILETEASQAVAFADFARSQGHKVLGFWDWDSQLNPQRFQVTLHPKLILSAGTGSKEHGAAASR